MANSDTSYADQYRDIDFRKQPEKYVVGRGEQGVLIAEPYKSEILPHWKFATPDKAETSAKDIYAMFETYKKQQDFVGMDMARKFLQMGFTRSRRYANHKSGRKYAHNPQLEPTAEAEKLARKKHLLPVAADPVKAASAVIFYEKYVLARDHPDYQRLMRRHREQHEKGNRRPEEERGGRGAWGRGYWGSGDCWRKWNGRFAGLRKALLLAP